MDDTSLREELHQSAQRNEALSRELEALRASQQRLLEEFAVLRHDHAALVDATQVIVNERDALRRRVAELEAANNRLVDMLWGRRSERRRESPDQRHLSFAEEADEPPYAEQQEIITAQAAADEALDRELLRRLAARRQARREKQRRSEEFPEHIEHRERTFDLSDEEKQGLKCIGVQITKQLRFEKPHLYVEVTKRPQYVVPGQPEQGVWSVPPPLAIVEGCKYDFSLIAAMLAMKFAFHVPTYRQQDWFAQCGWYPRRATTNDLVNYSVATIGPLFEQMWRLLLEQPILLGDDTRIRVLLRGALGAADWAALKQRGADRQTAGTGPPNTGPPGSALSYAWLYTSLDGLAPYNVFHWSLTHRNEVIDRHLAPYHGIFVGDACGANARLQQRSDGRITHAGCNAHARREFVNAEANDPLLASQAISFYRQLYEVEDRAVTLDAIARQALRQRDAVPIWNRMRRWRESDAARRALPQSAIGKALGYLRNHWTSLTLYLGDARIPIDNDQSERIIRPLTVGRANWLFLGHPRAAAGRLRLYSIVSSAHRHHLVIEDYLEDILRQLADAQQNHPADLALGSPYLLDLLRDRWAAAHPQCIRHDRLAERQAVADDKRWRRIHARIGARTAPTVSR